LPNKKLFQKKKLGHVLDPAATFYLKVDP
jgi:hypothetical protein